MSTMTSESGVDDWRFGEDCIFGKNFRLSDEDFHDINQSEKKNASFAFGLVQCVCLAATSRFDGNFVS